jgi:hypothetical protein
MQNSHCFSVLISLSNRQPLQTPIDEVQIERPAEIDEDLADDRQAPKDQKESPDGKVLPNERVEKRGRLDECRLKLASDPTEECESRQHPRQIKVKERFTLKGRYLVLNFELPIDEPVVDRCPAGFPEWFT